jgi:TonB family protein
MMASIVEWTLRSSLLGLIVWLLLKVLRVANPRLERSTWRWVLFASLAMPLLMTLADLSPAPIAALDVQAARIALLPPHELSVHWPGTALLVFLLSISAALILRQAWGTGRWWHARRMARPISLATDPDLDVRASTQVSSPVTVFSTVLVPLDFEHWSSATRNLAMAHERAHVASKDFYVQWLAQFHRGLFWFNPFSWWLASRLSLLSEHVSDDAAAELAEERTTYARLLLSLVQGTNVGSEVVPMVRGSSVGPRIERILRETRPAAIHRSKYLLLACALLPIISTIAAVRTGTNADIVLPRSNPQKPLSIPMYPPASRRVGEHGTVVLKLHVLEDGSVADAVIDRSSGYPDLDYAAMYESFRWRLDPGTIDGAPSRMWGRFAVTFKLDKNDLASARP